MSVIYYTNINATKEQADKIRSVLNDANGWNKYGFKFVESKDNKALKIFFISNNDLVNKFGSKINGLSCYVPYEYSIYFNINNWNGESKSTMCLDRYRTYVINHEFGHALGLGHSKCPGTNRKGSVMQQMTKGPNHIYPCIENEYPLDVEDFDEIKSIRTIKGGSNSNNKLLNIMLLLYNDKQ